MSDVILVTGGAGFIGTHLVKLLLDAGQTVRVLEKPGIDTTHLPIDAIDLVEADIRDAAATRAAIAGSDIVLHLAANPNLWCRDRHEFDRVNHQGTRHVLDAARQAAVKRIVHVSTESILAPKSGVEVIDEETQTTLDEMIGPYCRSKWQGEQAAREAAYAGQPVVIVNPTVPIGPGDRLVGPPSRMICDFCNGRIKGYLDADINLIDVRDVAAGIWAAAQQGEPGRRYLLSNEDWRILDLFRFLGELTGQPDPRFRVPYAVALGFAHLEEWFCTHVSGKSPMATVTGVKLTRRPFRFDGSASAKALGLEYRSCREALKETVDWFIKAGGITKAR